MSILIRTFYRLSVARPRVFVLNKCVHIITPSLSLARSLNDRWTNNRSARPSVNEVLTTWHSKQPTVSPCATLKCLIEVTNLIRLTNNYKTLSSPEFKRLLQATVDTASLLSADQIVTVLWVIAKIKWANYDTIKKLVNTLHSDLSTLSDKSVGLIPWALVTLKIANSYKTLMNRIVKETRRRLEKDSFQDSRALANICWALAAAKVWPAHFTPLVERFIQSHERDISPRTLSMFLHAMSRTDNLRSDKWLFQVIGSNVRHFKDTDPQSLILILWSMGNQKVYDRQLFNQLENEILSGSLVKIYNPRVIATLIWCCARSQYYSEDLLNHLSQQVPYFFDQMSLQDLGMVAYSFGYLNYPCPKLLQVMVDRVMELYAVQPVCFQVLLNLSWACLINQLYPRNLFEVCMNQEMIQRKLIACMYDDNICLQSL